MYPFSSQAAKPMGMLLQDPSFEEMHEDWVFPIDKDFLEGMGSSKLLVRDADLEDMPLHQGLNWRDADLSFAGLNKNKAYIDNPQFHQVNAFAVAGHTLAFVEEALGREMAWKHGGPLVIRPHAFTEANAFYDPASPSLNFGSFASPFRRAPVWTCLSHDVVSHELGHAILDSFRPLFLYSQEVDVGALHESVGDLVAMFSALEHKAVVEYLYRESGGDMRKPNILSGLAEEFGVGIQGVSFPYLRSALLGPAYGPQPTEPHARSTVWTAAIYDLLVSLVERAVPPQVRQVLARTPKSARAQGLTDSSQEAEAFRAYQADPANRKGFEAFYEAIVVATRRVKGMLIRAFHFMPPTGVTMPALARLIYEADARAFPNDAAPREVAKEVFGKRRLWDDQIVLQPPGIGPKFERLATAGPRDLARAVMEAAEALRIPRGLGARMLAPRLTTVTRKVDAGREGRGDGGVKELTEHYLYFAYELLTPACVMGPNGFEMRMASLFKGGALVMDENWKDLLLATDPDLRVGGPADGPGGPVMQAIEDASRRFNTIHRRALRAFQDGVVRSDGTLPDGQPALPFQVTPQSSGAALLVRRPCHLVEHLSGVSGQRSAFPFALRPVDLPTPDKE
jgi:hypothetical protein